MAGPFRAEIAGGGICGLATAAALARAGWRVRVHERQSALRTIGAGLYIWENGLRVLEVLGCYDAVIRDGHRGSVFEIRDCDGGIVDPGHLPPSMRVYTVPREWVLGGLRGAAVAAGAEIEVSSQAVGASEEGRLDLADGRRLEADLVIGAEGVRSRVRDSLGLLRVDDTTAEGSIRLIVPIRDDDFSDADRGKYIEQWAGHRRLLITPINRRETYLAFSALDSDPGCRLPLDRDDWKAAFPMWSHLIDRVTDDMGHWDVYSIIKLKAWSVGHVAVIGDAAHAQPPNLGQGAGMAMQNALALAHLLDGIRDRSEIPARLRAWEASERPIVEHCQKYSALYGEVIHMPEMLRRRAFAAGMNDPWLSAQFFKPALHHPTGCP
ncbi:FAD-dependent monooxygenase [Zavarzinia compransoris]|uniref:FAD-dependent oxidoreductase n=1 Tax=Zavarzinia marina TaxID=2911065 RepID=UPI001F3A5F55|nr:NAD(P)/FAD-dependent oxidoreductase [Zavarzinia marina]MCF4167375.1 FAD-dependent monooxygenase [Zavarzinia marina]